MKPFLKTKDFSVSQESFELFHDLEMDMLVTKPCPINLAPYYESQVYISHTDANNSFIDKLYQFVKRYSLRKKVGLIDLYFLKTKTVLDVGAGTGDFLKTAKNKGWNIAGVEPNKDARFRARQKGVELFSDLEELPKGKKYELITLWHVLEHLPNLEKQIENLLSYLDENGTLVIAVPNFKSYDAKHYKEFWAAYDTPRHLWHFSKIAIKNIFFKKGLKLVNVKPMLFDAFYVSLLSEKYKTGKQNLIKGFLIGLWSNLSGLSTKEYSSHIYILKRI